MSSAAASKNEKQPEQNQPDRPANESGPVSLAADKSRDQAAQVDEPVRKPGLARRLMRSVKRLVLLVLIPLAVVAGVGYFMLTSGRYVATENAYVKTDIVSVAPSIDGRVTEVLVKDNQAVEAGDVLIRLNPRPHEIAFDRSLAQIEAAIQEVQRRRAEYNEVQAEVAEAREKVAFYQREFNRQQELSQRGVSTQARLDEASFNLAAATREVRTLEQKSLSVLASLGGNPSGAIEDHPLFLEAQAEREHAMMMIGFTEIRAPASGVVSQMRLQPGEWIESGDPVFGITKTEGLWVEANLKETQLTHLTEGQSVNVEIDAYPGVEWPARIASISSATGAEFSILPPQNASGNWVKVVQRLPIRIEILETADRPKLRAGMTATVTIDTERDRSLPVVLGEWRQTFSEYTGAVLGMLPVGAAQAN